MEEDNKTISWEKIEGKVRGVVLITDSHFVMKEKGKETLLAVEGEMVKLGFHIKYEEIKTMEFYPLSVRIASLLAIKKVCGFSEEKIREMGANAPKISLIIKLFLKYFSTLTRAAEKVSLLWSRHYTVGELWAKEVVEEKKVVMLELGNFTGHPLFCQYLNGYFSMVVQLIIGKAVTSQETKCPFSGDSYHEFSVTW